MNQMMWPQLPAHILAFEAQGLVTRTFRRLDPERQKAIVDAILDEANAKGPANLNIKQVAHLAGVSVGSLYTYFENRESLLAFTMELCGLFMIDLFANVEPYLIAVPLREGLGYYLSGGVDWSRTQQGLVQFFLKAAYQGEPDSAAPLVRAVGTAMQRTVKAMLAAAVARGEVRDDLDMEATVRVINALTLALGDSQLLPALNTYYQVSGEGMPWERVFEAMTELVFTGLEPAD